MATAMRAETVADMPDVITRAATPADVPQLIELVRIALDKGSVPRTEAFWRWKHEQNPFGPSPAIRSSSSRNSGLTKPPS